MNGSNWVSAGANDIDIICTSKNTVEFFMTLHYSYEKSFKWNVKLIFSSQQRCRALITMINLRPSVCLSVCSSIRPSVSLSYSLVQFKTKFDLLKAQPY